MRCYRRRSRRDGMQCKRRGAASSTDRVSLSFRQCDTAGTAGEQGPTGCWPV